MGLKKAEVGSNMIRAWTQQSQTCSTAGTRSGRDQRLCLQRSNNRAPIKSLRPRHEADASACRFSLILMFPRYERRARESAALRRLMCLPIRLASQTSRVRNAPVWDRSISPNLTVRRRPIYQFQTNQDFDNSWSINKHKIRAETSLLRFATGGAKVEEEGFISYSAGL